MTDGEAGKLEPGDTVEIINDTDGPTGRIGTVRRVYRSGRCCVYIDEFQFRNFMQSELRKVRNETAG